MIRAGIVGATGYAGEELYRLLTAHPEVEVACAVSKSFAGQRISQVYASYFGKNDRLLEALDAKKLAECCDVVFTALPHGQSMEIVPMLAEQGVKVIDLSGDFRYNDPAIYEKWYGIRHTHPELMQEAIYGLCELYREEIRSARIVANPGCYTTTSILPLYPLLAEGLIQKEGIIIDAKSGVSGAGRTEKLAFSFCEAHENFKAYGVTTHRHTSEIEQELSIAAGSCVSLSFTPHLLPVKRGILSTIYAALAPSATPEAVAAAYGRFYGAETFVHVLPHGHLPELKHVAGSNNCCIGYQFDQRLGRLILVSCTDNLIKGAAGQAVQNMNLLFGMDEAAGLPTAATYL